MATTGVELAAAYVSLAVDGSQVDRGVTRALSGVSAQADRVGRDSGRRMGSGISSGVMGAVTRMAGPLAAVFAGIGVGKILGDSISEALEAEKVSAATAAIVKSTGGAAKVTADQVGALSESLSEQIGVDDELIQSSANLLLTFKRVRNEAGKGNDVFNQALATAQDISAAGFGSTESAAKMLGKALNDPVKGITALSRAGVTFTDAQKKQIKEMAKSGDLLGAQKLILDEIESQVGGVAKATATTADKVGVAWDNMKERLGTALLPILERVGNWFLDEGLPAIQQFGSWIKDNLGPTARDLGNWFRDDALPKLKDFAAFVKDDLWPALKEGWQTIKPGLERAKEIIDDTFSGENGDSLKSFGRILVEDIIPAVSTFASVALPAMATQFSVVVEAIRKVGAFFELQIDLARRFFTLIIDGFVTVTTTAAAMLDALSVVPGFGWAKDAADKLRGAAEKATGLKDAINDIPRNVGVKVNLTTTGQVRLPNGVTVDMGVFKMREHGGPVQKGQPYIVGEKRPELFVPNQSGKILPRVPEPAAAGVGDGAGLDYYRLADVLEAKMRRASFAVGVDSVSRAVNGRIGDRKAFA